jgi:uncharacterized coiled-coil protein SlyX
MEPEGREMQQPQGQSMDDDRLARLEKRLEELEKRESAVEKTVQRSKAAMSSMLPSQTREHMRAAGREQLLIVRSLLDHWVKRLDETAGDKKSDKQDSGREKIPID